MQYKHVVLLAVTIAIGAASILIVLPMIVLLGLILAERLLMGKPGAHWGRDLTRSMYLVMEMLAWADSLVGGEIPMFGLPRRIWICLAWSITALALVGLRPYISRASAATAPTEPILAITKKSQ
jgi:hypothetical protein